MAFVRAAYAKAYVDSGTQPEPFPLLTADKYRMRSWAELPLS